MIIFWWFWFFCLSQLSRILALFSHAGCAVGDKLYHEVFDDYGWDQVMEHLPPKKCPRMAIDAFLAMFEDELLVLEHGYQCIVQKIVMPK